MLDATLARLDRHLPVLLGLVLVSFALHAPPVPSPAGAAFFGGGQDPAVFVWFLNWWSFALGHGLPVWSTSFVDWPAGADLAWKTSVPSLGLLLAPVIRVCGALGVYNALMGLASPLAGFATYLAARELTRRFWPAVIAGLLFAFMPYQTGQNIGHLNLCFTAAIPAALFVTLRAQRQRWPAWVLGVTLGLLLAFEFGVSQELFASLVLFSAAALSILFWRYQPSRAALRALAPGLCGGLVLAVLLTTPALWQMWRDYRGGAGQLSEPLYFSSDVLNFIVPNRLIWAGAQASRFITDRFTGNSTEQGAYLGIPLIGLLVFIARDKGLAQVVVVIGAIAAVLSLGPLLHMAGVTLSTAPWLAFYHVPLLHDLLPARFTLYSDLAASLAVAIWLARPGVWRWPVIFVCVLPLLPSQQADRAWTHMTVPGAIAALPLGADITILPLFGQEMGLQYLDGMKFKLVAQGYLGTGLPKPFSEWPLYPALWNNNFAAIDPAQFAKFLATYGTHYVAVLPEGYAFAGPGIGDAAEAKAANTLLQTAGWRPATITPQATIYVPSGPPLPWTAPQAAPPAAGPTDEQRLHRRMTILTAMAMLSALAVWADARFRARRPDAAIWLVATFFAWIVALPAYLVVRLSRRSSSRG